MDKINHARAQIKSLLISVEQEDVQTVMVNLLTNTLNVHQCLALKQKQAPGSLKNGGRQSYAMVILLLQVCAHQVEGLIVIITAKYFIN